MFEISRADWLKEAERRYGASARNWKFRCPVCGHVQTPLDFVNLGQEPEDACSRVSFSCIGRWLPKCADAFSEDGKGKRKGPCNYTNGGLITLGPIRVKLDGDDHVLAFDFADEPLCPDKIPAAAGATS